MTLEQTITIPADRRLVIDVPQEIPVGMVKVAIIFSGASVRPPATAVSSAQKAAVWEHAALLAREEYLDNKELTAFSVLDGEAFL
jgi:hypothetical protein